MQTDSSIYRSFHTCRVDLHVSNGFGKLITIHFNFIITSYNVTFWNAMQMKFKI